MTDFFVRELPGIVTDEFTGQIILHCKDGQVIEYEKRQKVRPQRNGEIDIQEVAPESGSL